MGVCARIKSKGGTSPDVEYLIKRGGERWCAFTSGGKSLKMIFVICTCNLYGWIGFGFGFVVQRRLVRMLCVDVCVCTGEYVNTSGM